MLDGTIFFGSTGQRHKIIDKTFIKGFLTIQDQELFKSHNGMNANFVSNTVKSRFSGAKTAPLAVRVFTTLRLTLACEQQTHFRSSLLSHVFSGGGGGADSAYKRGGDARREN